MADPISPSTTTIKVKVDGKELDEDDIVSVEVQADLNQPDMVDLCLSNLGEAGQSGGKAKRHSSTFKAGATLEVLMGQAGSVKRVFLGRVIGCVPTYDTHHAGHVSVHGMNDLHNLARERRTRTFCNVKDQDIVQEIAKENCLTPKFGKEAPTLQHEHLYQWNVTDLDFLRLRAARTARNLWVDLDNKTLYYMKYEKDQTPVVCLSFTEEGDEALECFSPQSNAGAQTKVVKVYGWDHCKKERIVGEFCAPPSPLGQDLGATSYGDDPDLNICEVPVRSKEEADLIAESICTERNMNYITGHLTTKGNADIKLGAIIEIKANDCKFDGKYYVAGVRHRYSHGGGQSGGASMGGFSTEVFVQRDAGMGNA